MPIVCSSMGRLLRSFLYPSCWLVKAADHPISCAWPPAIQVLISRHGDRNPKAGVGRGFLDAGAFSRTYPVLRRCLRWLVVISFDTEATPYVQGREAHPSPGVTITSTAYLAEGPTKQIDDLGFELRLVNLTQEQLMAKLGQDEEQ